MTAGDVFSAVFDFSPGRDNFSRGRVDGVLGPLNGMLGRTTTFRLARGFCRSAAFRALRHDMGPSPLIGDKCLKYDHHTITEGSQRYSQLQSNIVRGVRSGGDFERSRRGNRKTKSVSPHP